MRHSMRRQKDKDIPGEKGSVSSLHRWILAGKVLDLSALLLLKTKIIQAFMGVIFMLVMTLFLVILRDRGSVVQVGLHLPLWPQTSLNLRATSEFNHDNVYPGEQQMKIGLRQSLRSLTTEEEHNNLIAKSTNNMGLQHDRVVLNQESDDHHRAIKNLTDSLHPLEDAAATATLESGGNLLQQQHPSSNATSILVAENDLVREMHLSDEGKGWVQFPYIIVNETEQLMLQVTQNGTLPCHNIRTQSAQILGLPQPSKLEGEKGPGVIRLYAGPVYELMIVSIGEDDQRRCAGGDYYETDLSGELWKSRPPVLDCNNGSYSVRLQMDPRFASGIQTLRIVLLFSNFHALHYHPQKWTRMEVVAQYQIKFVVPKPSPSTAILPTDFRSEESHPTKAGSDSKSHVQTKASGPKLPMCKLKDFSKKYWSGRWTREKATKDCEYDRYGRWRCVDPKLKCQKPWCKGRVGRLESNGWVYSAHCAFQIFEKEEAWKCLDGKWLFFWGDSNHMDTIRNLLNFVLGFEQRFIDRRMDMTYVSSTNTKSSVRITSIFNGHSNVSMNYEGLFSLHDPEFAQHVRSFFTGDTAPHIMIMNSGLHDGIYWKDVQRYRKDGVEFAAKFWANVWSQMKARRPDVLYRTTIATGGGARNLSFNPHKMELFNHLMLDRFLRMELDRFHIIDGFDYTYPWHYDHKTNDGVHYGRPPSKSKWAGGNIGHRYFVDLMLVHMLLNAICVPSSHDDH